MVKKRLFYAEKQLEKFEKNNELMDLENVILNLRKILEIIAYASIAPNKKSYSKFRNDSERPVDFRKDYHGGYILKHLSKINEDFYPKPLLEPKLLAPRRWHFDSLADGYLTKNEYIKLYDRLGKYLHADNPWGNDKGYMQLAKELPSYFAKIRNLLRLHATFVQDAKSRFAFVVELGSLTKNASMITAIADGAFIVDN